MPNRINKSICVIDHSDFIYAAVELTKYFDKVYYCYTDWRCGFKEVAAIAVGMGIKGVEHILKLNDYKDDIDIFFFTDIEFIDIANDLRREGRDVWGSGDVEEIEANRDVFLDSLKEAGLNVPDTDRIKGFDDLTKYLKGKNDVYVKISGMEMEGGKIESVRGLRETFHYENDIISANKMDEIRMKSGALKNRIIYHIQKPIKSPIEWGCDFNAVGGRYPSSFNFGFERKAQNYICRKMDKSELTKEMQEVHDKYEKVLMKYNYTGSWGEEVRVSEDGKHYFIDPTPRMGFPSSATYFHMGTNWGDVINDAMNGKITELEVDAKYGVETIIHTSVKTLFNPILFDEKYIDNVMPCVYCIEGGITYRLPNDQLYNPTTKLCTVVTKANNLDEAIEKNIEICNSIKSDGMEFSTDIKAFSDKSSETLLKETGIKF